MGSFPWGGDGREGVVERDGGEGGEGGEGGWGGRGEEGRGGK